MLFRSGFKRERIPKLEVCRAEIGEPLLHPHDENIVAIASDRRLDTSLPQFDLDQPHAIADFILKQVGLR